jgi:PAS domain S-box-containing protein
VLWEVTPHAAVGSAFREHCQWALRHRTETSFEHRVGLTPDHWCRVRCVPTDSGGLIVSARHLTPAEPRVRPAAAPHASGDARPSSRQDEEQRFRLEEQVRLLAAGVAAARDCAVFLLDRKALVTTWNVGAEALLGYTEAEMVGQHVFRLYEQETSSGWRTWARELEAAARREGRYMGEGWRVRRDGTRFWAHVAVTALRDETGALGGFGVVLRDLHEQQEREWERARHEVVRHQRRFAEQVLEALTDQRFYLCEQGPVLPVPLAPEPVGEPIPLTGARSLRTVRARVAEVAAACALPQDGAEEIVTAAAECAMNALIHTRSGTARVYGDPEAGRVQVWVEDPGVWNDAPPPSAALRDLILDYYSVRETRFGFSIMIAFCERVWVQTGLKGTTVVLERGPETPEPWWRSKRF